MSDHKPHPVPGHLFAKRAASTLPAVGRSRIDLDPKSAIEQRDQ
jgi:hypothetical protein